MVVQSSETEQISEISSDSKEVFLIYHSEVREMALYLKKQLNDTLKGEKIQVRMDDDKRSFNGHHIDTITNNIITSADAILCVSQADGFKRSRYLRIEWRKAKGMVNRSIRPKLFVTCVTVGIGQNPELVDYGSLHLPESINDINDNHIDKVRDAIIDSVKNNELWGSSVRKVGLAIHESNGTSSDVEISTLEGKFKYCGRDAVADFLNSCLERESGVIPLIALMIESGSFHVFYKQLRNKFNVTDDLVQNSKRAMIVSSSCLYEIAMDVIYNYDIRIIRAFQDIVTDCSVIFKEIEGSFRSNDNLESIHSDLQQMLFIDNEEIASEREQYKEQVKGLLSDTYIRLLECINWKLIAICERNDYAIKQAKQYPDQIINKQIDEIFDKKEGSTEIAIHLGFRDPNDWYNSLQKMVSYFSSQGISDLSSYPMFAKQRLSRNYELNLDARERVRTDFFSNAVFIADALLVSSYYSRFWQYGSISEFLDSRQLRYVKSHMVRFRPNRLKKLSESSQKLLGEYIRLIGLAMGYQLDRNFGGEDINAI